MMLKNLQKFFRTQQLKILELRSTVGLENYRTQKNRKTFYR